MKKIDIFWELEKEEQAQIRQRALYDAVSMIATMKGYQINFVMDFMIEKAMEEIEKENAGRN